MGNEEAVLSDIDKLRDRSLFWMLLRAKWACANALVGGNPITPITGDVKGNDFSLSVEAGHAERSCAETLYRLGRIVSIIPQDQLCSDIAQLDKFIELSGKLQFLLHELRHFSLDLCKSNGDVSNLSNHVCILDFLSRISERFNGVHDFTNINAHALLSSGVELMKLYANHSEMQDIKKSAEQLLAYGILLADESSK